MMGELVLIAGAGITRLIGGALREEGDGWPGASRGRLVRPLTRLAGWSLCTVATWLAISAAGAWFPLWPVLVVGVLGALAEILLARGRSRRPEPVSKEGDGAATRPLRAGADVILVLVVGLASIPSLPLLPLIGLSAVIAGGAWGLDRAASRLPVEARVAGAAVAVPALLFGGYQLLADTGNGLGSAIGIGPHLAVAPVCEGERVTLETGATAWLDRPPAGGATAAALVFHGANPAGSRQPAACVMRRALAASGLLVLAVDHPGYGFSPAPDPDDPVSEWNPLATHRDALDRALGEEGVEAVLALGHSLGSWEVLRLMGDGSALDGGVIFGAGFTRSEPCDDYWYGRFHEDRGMEERLPRSKWCEIAQTIYSLEERARELPAGHPPLRFVRFGIEWPDLTATRDSLYRMLSEPASAWTLEKSTHYFSSYGVSGLIVGDPRVTRRLTEYLKQFTEEVIT